MKDYKIVCVKLYDNQGQEIILTRYNTHNVKYAYYDEELNWVKSTDYNYEQYLNILWLRIPYTAYKNKFLLNIAVDTEQVYTSGVIDVDWSDLPNATPLSLTMVATIDDNAQGFAPRIIKVDGTNYWFEYSQKYGGLYNTNIPVVNEIVAEGAIDITSDDNSVGISKKTNPATNVLTYDLSVANSMQLTNLQITSADTTTDKGVFLPKNSTIYINADGTTEVKGMSSNHDFYEVNLNQDYWYRLVNIDRNCMLKMSVTIMNKSVAGMVYATKNGYTYNIYCTSKELAQYIKMYHSGVACYLMIEGNSHISSSCKVEAFDSILWIGSPYTYYAFDPDNLQKIPYFITDIDLGNGQDYINITGKTYTQDTEQISITNYNFSQDLTYTLTTQPTEYLSLKFVATQADTHVTVRVGDVESTCEDLAISQQAIFTWYDKDNYGWTYSYTEDFNDLQYSSGTTEQGVTYYNIIRKGDKKVVFDLLDFNNNWTIINNNYEALQTSVDNLWTAIQTINDLLYKHGQKDTNPDDPLDYRYVSAITVNNNTYYPSNSVVDLGNIGGNATNLSAYTAQYSTTFYEAGERKIKYNDKNGTYHEDSTSAQWIYPKSDSAITCTQAVTASFWNSGAVPTIALLSGYVSEQIPVRSNEIMYNGTFVVTETSNNYVMNCIMDNDTLVDVFYKGQWVRMSRFSTKHPLLVSASECNELNVYINSANTGTFYFNGLQNNDIIQFAVRKGRCQVGILDGSTTKAVVMQPHTIDKVYETPAYYNITTAMMIVAGVRQTSTALVNPTAIDEQTIRKNMVVDINLSSSNYNIYLPNMPVARGKVTRYLLVHSTNTSGEVQFELRSTSSGYTLHSNRYSLAPNGQVLVKATYDALLSTWFIG